MADESNAPVLIAYDGSDFAKAAVEQGQQPEVSPELDGQSLDGGG